MKKAYFYDIYGIRFIWHGAWSDPELIWHGKSFNYYDLENALYSTYQEEQSTLAFEIWVKKNAHIVRDYLQNLLDNKCFYGGITQ